MRKARINELNALRTFAFFAVVLQHVLGAYRGNSILPWESAGISVAFLASKFAVPAFVFVSGLVLFYQYYDELNYGSFILKRAREILLPYAIWTCFYFLYYNPQGTRSYSKLLEAFLLGKGGYHLWYVVMIFQFYILFPLYRYAFKKMELLFKSVYSKWAVFGVFTLLYLLFILIPSYFTPKGILVPKDPVMKFLLVDFYTRNSISYLFYFVVGGVIGLNIDKFREILKRHSYIITGAFILVFTMLEVVYLKNGYSGGKINLMYPSFFKPEYFVLTLLTILAVYRLSICRWMSNGTLSKVFAFIGKHSFEAYLAHVFTLNMVARILYKTGITFRPLLYFMIFAGCIISALCLAFLIDFLVQQIKMRAAALIKPKTIESA